MTKITNMAGVRTDVLCLTTSLYRIKRCSSHITNSDLRMNLLGIRNTKYLMFKYLTTLITLLNHKTYFFFKYMTYISLKMCSGKGLN